MEKKNLTHEQLGRLIDKIVAMGALCEVAIASAAKALAECDRELAEQVVDTDKQIDEKERELESFCLNLLQGSPNAREVRQISAALKMITDMERIGDQAADIAEIVRIGAITPGTEIAGISEMSREAINMVNGSVEAYVCRDVELARSVVAEDDVVDGYFKDIKNELIEMIAENPEVGSCAMDLLMIIKYLERIADHAVNLAEWAEFSITGIHNKTN